MAAAAAAPTPDMVAASFNTPEGMKAWKVLLEDVLGMDAPKDFWQFASMYKTVNECRAKGDAASQDTLLQLLEQARRAKAAPRSSKRPAPVQNNGGGGGLRGWLFGGKKKDRDPLDLSKYVHTKNPRGRDQVEELRTQAAEGLKKTSAGRETRTKAIQEAQKQALDQTPEALTAAITKEQAQRKQQMDSVKEADDLLGKMLDEDDEGSGEQDILRDEFARLSPEWATNREAAKKAAAEKIKDLPKDKMTAECEKAYKRRLYGRTSDVIAASKVLVERAVKPPQLEAVVGQETQNTLAELAKDAVSAKVLVAKVGQITAERESSLGELRKVQKSAQQRCNEAADSADDQKLHLEETYDAMYDLMWEHMELLIEKVLVNLRNAELQAQEKKAVEEDTRTKESAAATKKAGNEWLEAATEAQKALRREEKASAEAIVKHVAEHLKEINISVSVTDSLLNRTRPDVNEHVGYWTKKKSVVDTKREWANRAGVNPRNRMQVLHKCKTEEAEISGELAICEKQHQEVENVQVLVTKATEDFKELRKYGYKPLTAEDARTAAGVAESVFTVRGAPWAEADGGDDPEDHYRSSVTSTSSALSLMDETAVLETLAKGTDPAMRALAQAALRQRQAENPLYAQARAAFLHGEGASEGDATTARTNPSISDSGSEMAAAPTAGER